MCLILLAEDDADDRMMIRRAFKEVGRDAMEEFADGVELMDYLEDQDAPWREDPRSVVILLDLNMPRKSGRQALQEIKAAPDLKRIPVVVLTTSSSQIDITESYEAGANAYLTKPHSYSDLVESLRDFLQFWCSRARLPT